MGTHLPTHTCTTQTILYTQETKEEEDTKVAAKDSNAPRFEIKKWNAVAMWSWDICADTVSPLV
jgi:hypothetical protein